MYSNKTKDELIALCKERKIKGYSGKKKDDIIEMLLGTEESSGEDPRSSVADPRPSVAEKKSNKKNRGQFYTTNSSYILDGFELPEDIGCVIEPFAGKGDLIDWVKNKGYNGKIEAYDIEPKNECIIKRDTLMNPPDYKDKWIITNPPFLARNKCEKKDIFDLYDTNDLYKCFITSVKNQCKGGIFIIPAGFFFSPRDVDSRCRDAFMKNYKIIKIKYFEETVFDDTTTTVVAFSFEKSNTGPEAPVLSVQNVEWMMMPSKITKTFNMSSSTDWIIGGDIYKLPVPENIKVRRCVEGQELKDNEQQLYITLAALDSGTKEGRINLSYKRDYIYPSKECSRTYATFRITGKVLSENEQIELCKKFNLFLEKKREETWSLFLPQFRESKEYARKRIPFELAYRIFLHLLN